LLSRAQAEAQRASLLPKPACLSDQVLVRTVNIASLLTSGASSAQRAAIQIGKRAYNVPEGIVMPSLTVTLLLFTAMAQAQQNSAPAFEVATIKPAASDARGRFIQPGPGGGIRITNMTLKDMIEFAWQMQPFQLSGGPPWLDSVHYDIVAKPEAKTSFDEMRPMLQALLADRFQLRTHRETKELPIYALVLARKDGKLGPDLTESKEGSCEKLDPSHPPPPQPGAPLPRICGNMLIGPGQLTMLGHPISELTQLLSRMVERKVVDQTGLKGNFDISLQFPRDEAPPAPDGPPARIDMAGAIFSTFPDRLGLKFESTKGPVEVIVIDSAEKPSEN
jgi:uncharacterized protein (TIGR03435 family)